MNKLKHTVSFFFFILLSLLFISSCKKEEGISIPYSIIDLHEDLNVQKVFFLNNTVGFACGGKKGQFGSIYKTKDGGYSWQKIFYNPIACLYDVNFVNDTLGFACGENLLILRTKDGGKTWEKHEYTNLPPAGFICTLRSICVVNADAIYIAGGLAYESGLTYKTFNQGDFWIYNNFGNELRDVQFTSKYTGYYAGYGIIMKTTDSAHSFTPLSIQGDFYTGIKFTNSSTAVACGYNGGIYKTDDAGNSWNEQYHSGSAHIAHFNHLNFANLNIGYAVGSAGIIAFTTNGASWEMVNKFTDDNLFSVSFNNNRAFISGEGGKIYVLNN